jgi:hypothetical protein
VSFCSGSCSRLSQHAYNANKLSHTQPPPTYLVTPHAIPQLEPLIKPGVRGLVLSLASLASLLLLSCLWVRWEVRGKGGMEACQSAANDYAA